MAKANDRGMGGARGRAAWTGRGPGGVGGAAVLAAALALAAAALAAAAGPAAAQGGSKPPPPQDGAPAATSPAPGATATARPDAPAATGVPSVELAPGVTFEVVELRRMPERGVMQLRFAVTNRGPADTSLQDHGLAFSHQLRDIAVVDFGGRRQYSIGSAARCLCSTFRDGSGGAVRAGERREFWAWYGLPPPGARQMAIQIPDQPPILDVPLL